MFAGAAIYYKTRLQPTVAQSSTEAEFVNMADARKVGIIYAIDPRRTRNISNTTDNNTSR